MEYNIFIVEDDPRHGEILEYHLSLNPEYSITRFTTGAELLSNLYKKPDLITLDYSLPDTTGEVLYERIRQFDDQLPVVIISAQEEISVAVKLLKLGVFDYLVKDDNTKELLWNTVIKARERQQLHQEVIHLREELGEKYEFEKTLIGQSPALRHTFTLMQKAVRTNINISITGETGTGKEMVAKAIHYNSSRKRKSFVNVNMAAIPEDLIESELFGHEKGAFTGAVGRRAGKFEEANGGTIFLDEIAEMDLAMQSKLLRVLQERELTRIGGNTKIFLDVRLIVATHKNLAEEVQKGNFREDLYYRVIGLPVELAPLRDRGNDILILSRHFLNLFCKENEMGQMALASDAKEKLMQYNFPGNMRELKAMIDLAAVLSNGEEITADDITYPATPRNEVFMLKEKPLRQYMRDIISCYLKKYNNDVLVVTGKLEVGKSTIYKMLKDKEIVLDEG